MTTISNIQEFKTRLKSITRRTAAIRDDIQALCVYGFEQVKDHGNLTPLAMLILATKPLRTIRTATLESYIFNHLSAVVWKGKGKDKTLAKVAKTDLTCVMPEVTWYEYDNVGVSVPVVDITKRAKALIGDLQKAMNEEGKTLAQGQSEQAGQLINLLTPFADGEHVEVTTTEEFRGIA